MNRRNDDAATVQAAAWELRRAVDAWHAADSGTAWERAMRRLGRLGFYAVAVADAAATAIDLHLDQHVSDARPLDPAMVEFARRVVQRHPDACLTDAVPVPVVSLPMRTDVPT